MSHDFTLFAFSLQLTGMYVCISRRDAYLSLRFGFAFFHSASIFIVTQGAFLFIFPLGRNLPTESLSGF